MNFKLVKIDWEDSRQPTASWQLVDDVEPLGACQCVSVGYLISESDGVKRVAANLADVDDPGFVQASGIITIPDSCIKQVTDLSQSPVTA